ncbi:conserved hypothetical protein [Verticillium alfalfae VaMs.102]|uniref:RNA 3'-terminal phosphate cyclase domain-containing protein n=1 Tax=Verticillium alfalfae (strain VaMs.102 / ATCC MYA-4576 / FGSC 10136) TaxID=526221 RepID=C9SBH3_VERA1|nr:conserved hypothetical protein [Verticillium alfalfae VaMs.102]EEY15707.1 conserved hypothetical protein [Verticillium alfalfae VaMs.102]
MEHTSKPIQLDGWTGEGGGQVLRVAVALAAVTSQPVTVSEIRGNRLKSQHATSIQYLAAATAATTTSLAVGARCLTFSPTLPPADLAQRHIAITPESPGASALLILQALLPFLIFAAGDPITLDIAAGTNVSFSLSWDYADQVLLPALESRFGISVTRTLIRRGWSLGPPSRGAIRFGITPLERGEKLRPRQQQPPEHTRACRGVTAVDVTILAPRHLHGDLQAGLVEQVSNRLPASEVVFRTVEDSGHNARVYVLLVARSAGGLRWGRDVLTSTPQGGKSKGRARAKEGDFPTALSRKLVVELAREVERPGVCDEYLQDQLVVFQALARGKQSSEETMPQWRESRRQSSYAGDRGARDRRSAEEGQGNRPFGQGSLHSQTARWVASEMLPVVKWYNKGTICEGAGVSAKNSSL